MKRFNRANLVIAVMTIFTMAGFASTIVGTLAWYAYSTRITLSLTGTSVRNSIQLEIGIVDDSDYISAAEAESFKLTRIDEDGHSIVWNKSASGFTSDMIAAFLENSPFSTNELSPVSTLGRSGDDDLTLYESPDNSPIYGESRIYDEAETKNYVQIPFAFRVLNSLENPVANQKIWITDVVAASEKNMEKAIRVFVDDITNDTRYLFRPASTTLEDPGETVVAGMLDLDADGYYDYNYTTRKEYIYGDIEVDGGAEVSYLAARADSTGFIDENGTGDTSQDEEDKTTFYARHYAGTKSPDLTDVTFKTAEYETKKSIYPTINGEGDYEGGKPVTSTPNNASKIAYSTLTIFIEGWDHVIVDEVAGLTFYLGLQFEINKVSDE